MLPNIKSLLGKNASSSAQAERMPADEGMRYRREMLHQSIRESMLAMEVLSNMYKFKVVNVDEKQHIFIVMIEVSKLFQAKWNGVPASFAQAEQRMMTGALHRAGVTLQGVYWRVNEAEESFVMPARAGDGKDTSGMAMRTREVPGDVTNARVRLARRSDPSQDPQTSFPAGKGRTTLPDATPPVQEPKSDIGSTQYGQL